MQNHTEIGRAATVLADAAARVTPETVPATVRGQAADLFLDTLAVAAAGLTDPDYTRLVDVLTGEPGPASIPGMAQGVPTATAIQLNGGATTVLQLQDGHRLGRGHPVSHMMPVLLALAEARDLTAETVLMALIAGYETGARVGMAMGGLNTALHDTGTWSTIAAAVAAAHAFSRGDKDVIRRAIETAAATALMPYRDLPLMGASAHHTYIGLGAVTGLVAAQSAVAGLTDLPGTLETFFGPRAGAAFDAQLLTAGLTADGQFAAFEILNAYIKVHPTCAHLHGANDAMMDLLNAHAFTAEEVDTIAISTYGAGLAFDNPAPENALAARFSHAAAAAIAVCLGDLNEQTLTDEILASPPVQALMNKVTVTHAPDLDQGYPAGRPAIVRVQLVSGKTLEASAQVPLGDSSHALPPDARTAKARRLLARRFGANGAEAVMHAYQDFVNGHPVAGLSHALRALTPYSAT